MTRRIDRVNALLREETSRLLTELDDPRLSSIVSIVRVDTSPDLRHARVYVSVLGDENDKANTLRALRSASGFLHQNMRKSLSLKTVPTLDFYLDETIERGAEVLELIKRVSGGGESTESA